MIEKPTVTVFMPTLNAQEYLVEALESLIAQSYKNFNVAIIDGGSSDLTADICNAYCKKDQRFSFYLRRNTTPPQRFNEMLSTCPSEFLLNAHSDDIQHPRRIERQIEHMLNSPETVLSGTDTFFWLHDFHNNWATSYNGIAKYPRRHEEIRSQLPFWWCFANPTLIFRVRYFQDKNIYMDTRYKFAGDYLFYWNIVASGKVDNMEEILVAYRHHSLSEGPMNKLVLENEGREIRTLIAKGSGLYEYLGPELFADLLELRVERNIITSCPSPYDNYRKLFRRSIDFARDTNFFPVNEFIPLFKNYLEQIRVAKGIALREDITKTTEAVSIPKNDERIYKSALMRNIAHRVLRKSS